MEHNKFKVALKPKDVSIDTVNPEKFLTSLVRFSILTSLLRTKKGSGHCDPVDLKLLEFCYVIFQILWTCHEDLIRRLLFTVVFQIMYFSEKITLKKINLKSVSWLIAL